MPEPVVDALEVVDVKEKQPETVLGAGVTDRIGDERRDLPGLRPIAKAGDGPGARPEQFFRRRGQDLADGVVDVGEAPCVIDKGDARRTAGHSKVQGREVRDARSVEGASVELFSVFSLG